MDNLSSIVNYDSQQATSYFERECLEKLHQLKISLDDFYYNTDTPLVSNEIYDILKNTLIKRDPNYIPPVGAKIRSHENRVKIPFWMGSVNTFTPENILEINRWMKKNNSPTFVVSEKLDGVSGCLIYNNGKKTLYTRGDGIIGANISHVIQYISNIPTISENIAVRGELIIRKDTFQKKYYSDGKETTNKTDKFYKNARNMVAGIIGAKTIRAGLHDIQFVAYEIIGNETMPKQSDQFIKLKTLGFTVAMNKQINIFNDIDKLVKLHNQFKTISNYEIDGIVVSANVEYDRNLSGNPEYLFAFKVLNSKSIYTTTVLDIEWNISQWGQIIPVAILKPITLPDIIIQRVSLSNAFRMKEKMVGPGAIVKITRSQEIIPYLYDVVQPCKELKWPDIEYKWDENNVHIKCNENSPEIVGKMKIKLISNFFASMNIKHISQATVQKLYNNGFNTLLKIINIKESDLIKIDGIHLKSANRIISNIRKGLYNVKAPDLLGAAGVFGYGIGKKRVIMLMTDIPDLLTAERNGLKERILEVDGFSDIMADKVINHIDDAVEFIDCVSKYVSFANSTRVSSLLVGQKFVFSGFRSKDLEQNIVDRGGKIVTSVSTKTSGIVVANKDGQSTIKISKALSLGIPIYTKDDFIKKFII